MAFPFVERLYPIMWTGGREKARPFVGQFRGADIPVCLAMADRNVRPTMERLKTALRNPGRDMFDALNLSHPQVRAADAPTRCG